MDRKKETLLGCVYFDWQSATTWACNGNWIGAQIGLFKVVLQTLSSSPLSAPFYSLQHSNCLPLQVPFTHSYMHSHFYLLRSAFLPSHTHKHSDGCFKGNLRFGILPKGTPACGLEESMINPLTFQLVANPLYLLSLSRQSHTHLTSDVWLKDKKMAVASLVRISLTYMSLLRFFYAF